MTIKESPKPVTREILVELGNRLVSHPDIESVWIDLTFKDGSKINYNKTNWNIKK